VPKKRSDKKKGRKVKKKVVEEKKEDLLFESAQVLKPYIKLQSVLLSLLIAICAR